MANMDYGSLAETHFDELQRRIEPARELVIEHPIYQRINDLHSLRRFMSNHVFAVWDFMTLLKLLQRQLTCVELPWLPPADTVAARLVNEIVLNEESDEMEPGVYMGHFHLYLSAMEEVDADSRPIRDFVAALRNGSSVTAALSSVSILPSTRRFVAENIRLLDKTVHEAAAAFLFGREDLVPRMFARLCGYLEKHDWRCTSFRRYLDRHIILDSSSHGPLARRLLSGLCGLDTRKWQEATASAEQALILRSELWDGIVQSIGPG